MAYTSARPSSGLPRMCSGDMYANLPFTAPARVVDTVPAALAMPKSTTLVTPLNPTSRLSGLTSRWTICSGSPSSSRMPCA